MVNIIKKIGVCIWALLPVFMPLIFILVVFAIVLGSAWVMVSLGIHRAIALFLSIGIAWLIFMVFSNVRRDKRSTAPGSYKALSPCFIYRCSFNKQVGRLAEDMTPQSMESVDDRLVSDDYKHTISLHSKPSQR